MINMDSGNNCTRNKQNRILEGAKVCYHNLHYVTLIDIYTGKTIERLQVTSRPYNYRYIFRYLSPRFERFLCGGSGQGMVCYPWSGDETKAGERR